MDDWERFFRDGRRSERYVGRLPAYLNGYLTSASREVRIAHEYVVKGVEKHGLQASHFAIMAAAMWEGEAYLDRPRHLTFLYHSADYARWFQLTIKCCTEKRRLFVTTFHRLNGDDVERKRKRYQKVWPLT